MTGYDAVALQTGAQGELGKARTCSGSIDLGFGSLVWLRKILTCVRNPYLGDAKKKTQRPTHPKKKKI